MGIHHSRLSLEASSSLRNLLHHDEGTLISLLYNQEWEKAIARLEKYPREAKIPFSLSKQSIYPLHAACALPEVPLSVIEAFMTADPEGPTRCSFYETGGFRSRSISGGDAVSILSSDDTSSGNSGDSLNADGGGGWLPLHVAVYYGVSAQIVEYLLQRYPAAATTKNGRGLLPLHLAVTGTILDDKNTQQVVQLLLQVFAESLYIPSSGQGGKTAFELVEETKTRNKSQQEALLELLNPRQSLGTSTKEITRVVQSISLENHSPPTHRRAITSLRARSNSLRPRSKSISSPTSPTLNQNPTLLATKLVLALVNEEWDEAVKRIQKKPSEAQVWTLSDSPIDPPCHSLPIFMALRRKAPPNVITALLKEYPESSQMREYYGMLPLHVACQSGASLEIVQAIYQANKEAAQVQDLTGMLPLHLACSSEACRRDVICFLLDAYPESLDIKDAKGMLAIEYVQNGHHPHQRLLEKDFGKGLDYWAAPTDVVLVQHLLHQRWDESIERAQSYPQEASIWTKHPIHGKRRYALHYACKYKAPPALVEALLQAHPEATQVPIDDYQLLPLHLACSHGAADKVVKLLLEYNKEAASVPDSLGLLPLHLAITEGASINVVQYLLEAYPNARKTPDKKGFVPYVYAESSHHPSSGDVMELLNELSLNDEQRRPSTKHGRDATSALLQTKRQKSDRSLQAAKVAPIMVE